MLNASIPGWSRFGLMTTKPKFVPVEWSAKCNRGKRKYSNFRPIILLKFPPEATQSEPKFLPKVSQQIKPLLSTPVRVLSRFFFPSAYSIPCQGWGNLFLKGEVLLGHIQATGNKSFLSTAVTFPDLLFIFCAKLFPALLHARHFRQAFLFLSLGIK